MAQEDDNKNAAVREEARDDAQLVSAADAIMARADADILLENAGL